MINALGGLPLQDRIAESGAAVMVDGGSTVVDVTSVDFKAK
jgi:hypothetical protein